MPILLGRYAFVNINDQTMSVTRWQFVTSAQEEEVTIARNVDPTRPGRNVVNNDGALSWKYIVGKHYVLGLARGELSFDAIWDLDENPYYGQPQLFVGSEVRVEVGYRNGSFEAATFDQGIPVVIEDDLNGWEFRLLVTRVEETVLVRDVIKYSVTGLVQGGYLQNDSFR